MTLLARAVDHTAARLSDAAGKSALVRGEQILGLPVKDGMWSTQIDLTPERARRLLEAMPPQRPLRRSEVEKLKALIRHHQWQVSHQGLGFNTQGRMLDGQHRCTAVVETGVTVPIWVTFNAPPESFAVVDRGEKRNLADDLHTVAVTSGPLEGKVLQAAIRIVWNLDGGRQPWLNGRSSRAPTLKEARETLVNHPDLLETTRYALRHPLPRMPASVMAAFHALFRESGGAEKADRFIEQVARGLNLEPDDPAYLVREYLGRVPRSARFTTARIAAMVVLTKAWNAFVRKRRMTRVDGAMRDGNVFPEILGAR